MKRSSAAFVSLLLVPLLAAPLPLLFSQSQGFTPSAEDLRFLDEVQRRAFQYFLMEAHPETGLVREQADNFAPDHRSVASIAAEGFKLAAYVVGAERGWISKEEAEKRCVKTLRFFLNQMESEHGFYFHFVDRATGRRTKQTELSSIDTALFLAGALTAGQYFKGTEVEVLADHLYERVDFFWMLNGGKTLSMGWLPDRGFLHERWNNYNESFILYLLAIASPTNPIPPTSWHEVNKRIGTYGNHALIYSPPLFTHQYSHLWVDFRNKNDGRFDYFLNSRTATLVNREFCLDQRRKFKTYSENVWGLTAGLGPGGYRAYGSPPGNAPHDGTVAPWAIASSIVFTPELSIPALRYLYTHHKSKLWGRYGFSDAFNLDRKWYARDVLGIDVGPVLLMIENYRTGLLWRLFMQHPAVQRGMERMGFRPGSLPLRVPPVPVVEISRPAHTVVVDGDLSEWNGATPVWLTASAHRELGEITDAADLEGRFRFAWDKSYLYLAAQITDDDVVANLQGDQIWKEDLIELFLDPDEKGLVWGDPRDLQIGLNAGAEDGTARSWAWFQGFDPTKRNLIIFNAIRVPGGYQLEAAISWQLIGVTPQHGLAFGLSPALHDVDSDGSEGKLNWYYLPDGKTERARLGQAVLRG